MVAAKKAEAAPTAVFPCRLNIITCFAKRDRAFLFPFPCLPTRNATDLRRSLPAIILGCDIIEGSLRVGTPLCVIRTDPETKKREVISLGKISSLEINKKTKDVVKKHEAGAGVAVKIEHASHENAKQFGRHCEFSFSCLEQLSNVADSHLPDISRREGRGSIDDLSSIDRRPERAFPSRRSQRRLATHQIPQDETRYRLISLLSTTYTTLVFLDILLFFRFLLFLSSFLIHFVFIWQNCNCTVPLSTPLSLRVPFSSCFS